MNHILQYEDAPPFDERDDVDLTVLQRLFETCKRWKRDIFNLMIFGEALTPDFPLASPPQPEDSIADDEETMADRYQDGGEPDIDATDEFVVEFAEDEKEELAEE